MKLDFLVIENVVAQMFPIERLLLNGVEKKFATYLRAANNKEHISLKISDNIFISFRQQPNCHRVMKDNEKILVQKASLENAFSCLFLHFKSFKCIRICGLNSDFICQSLLDALLCNACHPRELYRLKLPVQYPSKYTWRLIKSFSHLVKAISIEAESPSSNKLWKSVSQCSELRTLSFYQNYSDNCHRAKEEMQLSICLKALQISRFKSNASFVESDWLQKAFVGNDNLQSLFIQGKLMPTLAVTSLVVTLHRLTVDFDIDRLPQNQEEDIRTILNVLPTSCRLHVTQTLDGFQYFALANKDHVQQALEFWIRLSNETARDINLCLNFHHTGLFVVSQALVTLGFAVDRDYAFRKMNNLQKNQNMVLGGLKGNVLLSMREK